LKSVYTYIGDVVKGHLLVSEIPTGLDVDRRLLVVPFAQEIADRSRNKTVLGLATVERVAGGHTIEVQRLSERPAPRTEAYHEEAGC
jgi:hypothetical protein